MPLIDASILDELTTKVCDDPTCPNCNGEGIASLMPICHSEAPMYAGYKHGSQRIILVCSVCETEVFTVLVARG